MQDFPIDGRGYMSQVHHGNKMTEHLKKCGAPAVSWNDHSYFINELLLLKSGQYFIPTSFFDAVDKTNPQTVKSPVTPKPLIRMALGYQVTTAEVSK